MPAVTSKSETQLNDLSKKVIGSAIAVHRSLGPGLNEAIYEQAISLELAKSGIRNERQVLLPVFYKGMNLDCGYRLNLVVDSCLVLELKSAVSVLAIHEAQLLTYLRLSQHRLGLLLNFNVVLMKEGVSRWVNQLGQSGEARKVSNRSDNESGSAIIAAALEVHRVMGPGLLKSSYMECLKAEFLVRQISFQASKPVPIIFDGVELESPAEIDFLIEAAKPLMICSVREITPLLEAQFRSKIRLGGWSCGLIINFNSARLKDGLRMVGVAPQRLEERKGNLF